MTLYQLQRMLRLVAKPTEWAELLASRLDGLGMDIMGTIGPSLGPTATLISEAVWHQAWELVPPSERGSASQRVNGTCFRALGKLASAGIWFAAQLRHGTCWKEHRDVRVEGLTAQEYLEVLGWLETYPNRSRIDRDCLAMPGPRQLTLWELPARARPPQPAQPVPVQRFAVTPAGNGGKRAPVSTRGTNSPHCRN